MGRSPHWPRCPWVLCAARLRLLASRRTEPAARRLRTFRGHGPGHGRQLGWAGADGAAVVREGRERCDDDALGCVGLAAPRRAAGHADQLPVLHSPAWSCAGFQWLGLFVLTLHFPTQIAIRR